MRGPPQATSMRVIRGMKVPFGLGDSERGPPPAWYSLFGSTWGIQISFCAVKEKPYRSKPMQGTEHRPQLTWIRRRTTGLFGVSFAMILIVLGVWPSEEGTSELVFRTALMEFNAALGRNPAHGRLLGELPPEARVGDDSSALEELTKLRAQLKRAIDLDPSSQSSANRGVYELVLDRTDGAISKLEWAATDPEASTLNDLAVAYLTRAAKEDRVMDLIHALDAARRAYRLEPDLPETAFNFALTSTRLHLRRTAESAWARFLEIESDGPWAQVARDLLNQIRDRASQEGREGIHGRLLSRTPLPHRFIQQIVAADPYRAREACEDELLPRWVEAVMQGNHAEAELWLDRVATLAEELALSRGERLLADEVRSLRQPAALQQAEILATIFEAMDHYRKQNLATAAALFEKSTSRLREVGSPYALVAELYQAICRYYGDAPGAAEMLEDLLERVPETYPTVRGRVWWMRGTVAGGQRDFEAALRAYRQALPLIEQGAGPTRAASIHLLIAQALDARGATARGWKHRLTALEQLAYRGSPQRQHGIAFETAEALARGGLGGLSLLYLDEAMDVFPEYGMASAGVEILRERAKILYREGLREEALADLEQAHGLVAGIEEGAMKVRMSASLSLLEGWMLSTSDPAVAIASLDESRQASETAGYDFDELVYFSALAEAHQASGDLLAAQNTLRLAAESYQRLRRNSAEIVSRLESFRLAHGVFDRLIALALESPDLGIEDAFSWAERSRAQSILDLWRSQSATEPVEPAVVTAREVRERLPAGTVLVEYAIVGDRVLSWTFEGNEMRFVEHPIPSEDLARRVLAYSRALENQAEEETLRRQGTDLYRDLVAPLALDFSAGGRWIVVPDGPLQDVPFAALVDPATGRYVVEDVAVAVAPSATLFLLAETSRARLGNPIRPLVVGMPSLRQSPYRDLGRLPAAAEEVEAVAARFPGSGTLIGDEATRAEILTLLHGYDALHFVGHGISSANDWEASALVLAPAGPHDDGLLRVSDLVGGSAGNLGLVTLSACETLDGYEAGREGTMGLALGFFAAGVPSVVGTLWKVDDRVSSELMQAFYRELEATGSAAEALRQATIEWLGRADSRSQSPAYWGAFSVLGV